MSMTSAASEYFGQVAGQWDTVRAGYFTEAVRDAAIEHAYLRPEMVVADVGAGTGFVTAGLAPLVSRVHLLDGSAAMLDVARKNLSQFSNLEYHLADGQSLPLPDASVDAAFANIYLHHCADPLAAIREMARILKPGGRLVITDMDSHPYAWLKEELADVWQGFDQAQVRAWFKEAGMVNTIVTCSGQSCCAKSETAETDPAKQIASISIFVAAGTLRVAAREAVREHYAGHARNTTSCCGGETASAAATTSTCCSTDSGSSSCCQEIANPSLYYSAEERADVPAEAEAISLGCGNPLAFAAMQPGEVVLDIGSGGGMDSFLSAKRVGLTGKVIGVDMTPEMLARARATAEKNAIPNVEFRQGHAEALPVNDSTVHVVISNCVVNLVEDKAVVFGEAFRVLKPGGRLELSDMVTSGPIPAAARMDENGWSDCINGALPESEYLELIEQAGFEAVKSRRSPSMGTIEGVDLYSVIVSAKKPETIAKSCCS